MYCTECGSPLSDSFKYCAVCGHAVPNISSVPAGTVPPLSPPSQNPTPGASSIINPQDRQYVIGVVIFGSFSVLTLFIGIFQGLTPLSILETVGWGCAAWFWYKKKPLHPAATIAVGLLGVAVIIGEIWFYVEKRTRETAIDPYAQILANAGDTSEFVPPDAPDIKPWEKYASCQEAERLASACHEKHFNPTGLWVQNGGSPVPLPKFGPLPKGLEPQPEQASCDTSFAWKNYCAMNP